MEDFLGQLFANYNEDLIKIGSEDQFKQAIVNEDYARKFYNQYKDDQRFSLSSVGTENQFVEAINIVSNTPPKDNTAENASLGLQPINDYNRVMTQYEQNLKGQEASNWEQLKVLGDWDFWKDNFELGVIQGRMGNMHEILEDNILGDQSNRDPEFFRKSAALKRRQREAQERIEKNRGANRNVGRFVSDIGGAMWSSIVSSGTELTSDVDGWLELIAGGALAPTTSGQSLSLIMGHAAADVEAGAIMDDKISKYAQEKGLNLEDEADYAKVYEDQEFIDKAKKKALVGAAIVGTAEALSGAVGGRVFNRVKKMRDVGYNAVGKLTVGGAIDATGEATKQAVINEGNIDLYEVGLEGFAGAPINAIQAGAGIKTDINTIQGGRVITEMVRSGEIRPRQGDTPTQDFDVSVSPEEAAQAELKAQSEAGIKLEEQNTELSETDKLVNEALNELSDQEVDQAVNDASVEARKKNNPDRERLTEAAAEGHLPELKKGAQTLVEKGLMTPSQQERLVENTDYLENFVKQIPRELREATDENSQVRVRQIIQTMLDIDTKEQDISRAESVVQNTNSLLNRKAKNKLEKQQKELEELNNYLSSLTDKKGLTLENYDAETEILQQAQLLDENNYRIPRAAIEVKDGKVKILNKDYSNAINKAIGELKSQGKDISVFGQDNNFEGFTFTNEIDETDANLSDVVRNPIGESELQNQITQQQSVIDELGLNVKVVGDGEINSLVGRRKNTKTPEAAFDGKTVFINSSKVKESTLVHELAHAKILNDFGAKGPQVSQFHQSIKSALETGNNFEKNLGVQIEQILTDKKVRRKKSDNDIVAHEYLAELASIMAKNKVAINERPSVKRKIINAINDSLEAIIGFRPIKGKNEINDAINFMNNLAVKLSDNDSVSTDSNVSGEVAGTEVFFSEEERAKIVESVNKKVGGSRKFSPNDKKDFIEQLSSFLARNKDKVDVDQLYNENRQSFSAKGISKSDIVDIVPETPKTTKESNFARRALNQVIEVSSFSNKERLARASQIINDFKSFYSDKVKNPVQAEIKAYRELANLLSNRQVRFDTAVVMGQRLLKQTKALRNKKVTTPAQKAQLRDIEYSILENTANLGNEAGQALQAFRLWNQMDAQGWVNYADRVINKTIKNKFSKSNKASVEKIQQEVQRAAQISWQNVFNSNKDILEARDRDIFFSEDSDSFVDRLLASGKSKKDAEKIAKEYKKIFKAEIKKKFSNSTPKIKQVVNALIEDFDSLGELGSAKIVEELAAAEGVPLKPGDANRVRENIEKIIADYDLEGLLDLDSPVVSQEISVAILDEISKGLGDNALRYLHDKNGVGWSLYYASSLSGLKTHAMNIAGNAFKGVIDNINSSIIEFYQAKKEGRSTKDSFAIATANFKVLYQLLSAGFQKAFKGKEFKDLHTGRAYNEAADILFAGKVRTTEVAKTFSGAALEQRAKDELQLTKLISDLAKGKTARDLNTIADIAKAIPKDGVTILSKLAKWIPRFMSSVDALYYFGSFYGNLHQSTTRKAIDEGLTPKTAVFNKRVNDLTYGDMGMEDAMLQAISELDGKKKPNGEPFTSRDIRRRRDEILEQKFEELYGNSMKETAIRFGQQATFTQQPIGLMGSIASKIDEIHANGGIAGNMLRLIVPYTRTLANVVNDSLDYTPLGFVRSVGKTPYGQQAEKQMRIMSGIRAAEGVLLISSLYLLGAAFDGQEDEDKIYLHGGGPSTRSFQQRLDLMAQGWRPYSIETPSGYISYKELPIGIVLSIAGTLEDVNRYSKNGDERDENSNFATTAINNFALGILGSGQVVLEQSFLSGLSRTLDIIRQDTKEDPDKAVDKLSKFGIGLGRAAIPNIVREAYTAYDPTWYATPDVNSYIFKTFQLPLKYNTALKYDEEGNVIEQLEAYKTSLGYPIQLESGETKSIWEMPQRYTNWDRFYSPKVESEEGSRLHGLMIEKGVEVGRLSFSTKGKLNGQSVNLYSTDRQKYNALAQERKNIIRQYVLSNEERYKKMSKSEVQKDMEKILDGKKKNSALRQAKKNLGMD